MYEKARKERTIVTGRYGENNKHGCILEVPPLTNMFVVGGFRRLPPGAGDQASSRHADQSFSARTSRYTLLLRVEMIRPISTINLTSIPSVTCSPPGLQLKWSASGSILFLDPVKWNRGKRTKIVGANKFLQTLPVQNSLCSAVHVVPAAQALHHERTTTRNRL